MRLAEKTKLKILVIGSLPPPLGGTSVSLQHLVNGLKNRDDVETYVVDTSGMRGAGPRGLARFVKTSWRILRLTSVCDVVTVHVGLHALPIIGPIAVAVAGLFRKPLVIRRFGGNDHQELQGWKLRLVRWVIGKSALYLVQTKALIIAAEKAGLRKVAWFPTSRPFMVLPSAIPKRKCCRKFIFLSHVRPTKGIFEIISAAERFCGEISVTVFGPFYDGLGKEIFKGCQRVSYGGVVSPEQVPHILSQHDALLLPTYYPGEGYPGALLEAFTAGLPVIATRWKSIPEIVDDNCGILVAPKDSDALFRAMTEIVENEELYKSLSQGALNQRNLFNSNTWTERFVDYCSGLIEGNLVNVNTFVQK